MLLNNNDLNKEYSEILSLIFINICPPSPEKINLKHVKSHYHTDIETSNQEQLLSNGRNRSFNVFYSCPLIVIKAKLIICCYGCLLCNINFTVCELDHTIVSLWKSKLEAHGNGRYDSHIDSHWKNSRAAWVRAWNEELRSAGGLWSLRQPPAPLPVPFPLVGEQEVPSPKLGSLRLDGGMTLSSDLNPTALPPDLWPQRCTDVKKLYLKGWWHCRVLLALC